MQVVYWLFFTENTIDKIPLVVSFATYLDETAFQTRGIAVEWQDYRHPIYPQLHGPFVSHLSAIDLLLNVGGESLSIIRQGRPQLAGTTSTE